MNLDDWHFVYVSVCLVLVFAACFPVVWALLHRGGEPFFALAVLGEEGMADRYYPGDDPNIGVGDEIRWNLYVYNHVGEVEYVAVRLKLLNSTMSAPDSISCSPSPAPVVYEVRRVMLDNETWFYPISWSIGEVGLDGDFTVVEQLSVNDRDIETDVVARDGYNFRIVLELWIYSESLNDFQFGWSYDHDMGCAWNQLWFNATLPG